MDQPDQSTHRYVLVKGTLFYEKSTDSQDLQQFRAVVPDKLANVIFAYYHYGNHVGLNRLSTLINRSFYIKNLRDKLEKFVRTCALCALHHANTRQKNALGHTPLPVKKFSHYHIDLVMGFPTARRGFSAFLSVVCPFSGFRMAFPCNAAIKARTIAEILMHNVFMIFGPPKLLVSDGGANMNISQELKNLATLYGYKTKIGSPYSGKSHGIVEISNRYIRELVTILSNQYSVPWTTVLPLAVHNLNCMPRSNLGSGISPYYAVFGVAPKNQCIEGVTDSIHLNPEQLKQFNADLQDRVLQITQDYEKRMRTRNAERGGKLSIYPPGTLLYQKNFKKNPRIKWKNKYLPCPVRVVRDYGQAIYVSTCDGKVQLVHKDHTRPCSVREQEQLKELPDSIVKTIHGEYSQEELTHFLNSQQFPPKFLPPATKPRKPVTRSDTAKAASSVVDPDDPDDVLELIPPEEEDFAADLMELGLETDPFKPEGADAIPEKSVTFAPEN